MKGFGYPGYDSIYLNLLIVSGFLNKVPGLAAAT